MKMRFWQRKALLVAAFNSSDKDKARADYLCDGIDDNIEIQTALDNADGKAVRLFPGTYKLTGKAPEINNREELERSIGKLAILGIKRLFRALGF